MGSVSQLFKEVVMETAGLWTFIVSVFVVGLGAGFWLQGKIDASHQNVKFHSEFEDAA
jgi:hypothetical protein